MSAHDVPEHLKQYFGHDKVALHGSGGMPAAPPAPPGSTARKAGDNAVADGLAKAGTPGKRPGSTPAKLPPKPALKRAVRLQAERAAMMASQQRLTAKGRGIAPKAHVGWFWRSVFVPLYRIVPWALRKPMMRIGSGVRGWSAKR